MIPCSAAFDERTTFAPRIHQAIAVVDRFPPSILQLMFRVAIAAVFWSSGLTKIASWDTTIALFRDEYMVPLLPPEMAAVISATLELSCSALIVVGLGTRLATLPLLGMTFVIEVFVYPEYWTQHLMWASGTFVPADKRRGCLLARSLRQTRAPQEGVRRLTDMADGEERWLRSSLAPLPVPDRQSIEPPRLRSRRFRRRVGLGDWGSERH
jgi:putative oxidoreductase